MKAPFIFFIFTALMSGPLRTAATSSIATAACAPDWAFLRVKAALSSLSALGAYVEASFVQHVRSFHLFSYVNLCMYG